MLLFLFFFLTFVFLVLNWYSGRLKSKRGNRYPPGPIGIPYFGNYFQLGKQPHRVLTNLIQKYGPVMSFRIGASKFVVISDYKLLRTTFSRSGFEGRASLASGFDKEKPTDKGIIFSEGQTWREQRLFVTQFFRDFKFAHQGMEEQAKFEIQELLKYLEKTVGTPVEANSLFAIGIPNIILQVIAGKRFEDEDHEIRELLLHRARDDRPSRTTGVGFYLHWLPHFLLKALGEDHKVRVSSSDRLSEIIKDSVEAKRGTMTTDTFVGLYLKKIEDSEDPGSTFYDEIGDKNMEQSIRDIFRGSVDTTVSTLVWMILLLANDQEAQDLMRAEIRRVIGMDQFPKIADKNLMPIVEATINEVLRYGCTVGLTIQHRTTCATTISDYNIPENTIVLANLYGISRDPTAWEEPENFMPKRFLNESLTSLVRHEAFLFFGVGKRFCIGEQLARNEIFLYTVALIQKFRFRPHVGNWIDPTNCLSHTLVKLKPFHVVFEKID